VNLFDISQHIYQEFHYGTINRLKQIFFTFYETANSSVKISLYKVHSVAQNVHHRPKRIRWDICESRWKLCWSLSATSHPRSAAVHFLALGLSLALGEVCEMPEALHPHTLGNQVGWGLVNLVAIASLRRISKPIQLPSTSPCEMLKFTGWPLKVGGNEIKFCNLAHMCTYINV